jgi:hypothetical protein
MEAATRYRQALLPAAMSLFIRNCSASSKAQKTDKSVKQNPLLRSYALIRHQQVMQHPGRYLLRMSAFIILCAFIAFILHKPLSEAFQANPFLNGVIIICLALGTILSIVQILELIPDSRFINMTAKHHASALSSRNLLAPIDNLLRDRAEGSSLSMTTIRYIIDSVEARLDERRELIRYLSGLLVFLGLLGTFWGLIETVGSVGRVINSLRGGSESALMFDELKTSLSAPLAGMGISFSSSLFGLAGSLILGFLDLQLGQGQSRFARELEDWLSKQSHVQEVNIPPTLPKTTLHHDDASTYAIERLSQNIEHLVHNMRQEQQIIRDWVEAQVQSQNELKSTIKKLLETKT